MGYSPLISSFNSSLSLLNVRIKELSGNGSIVEVNGFSYSSFESISISHFSSSSSSMIRVENEGEVSIQDSSFEDCRMWNVKNLW